MNIWAYLLKSFGWKVEITAPRESKCVICVAPHTSNWDFILGLAAYKSLGRKANFLMKKFWFFFPLKYVLTYFGGIPVDRKNKNKSLTAEVIDLFNKEDYVNLAVTPEATRSLNQNWKTGFLYIAKGANVPIQLGIIDYKNKKIIIDKQFYPGDDIEKDLQSVKEFYSNYGNVAKYPENFSI